MPILDETVRFRGDRLFNGAVNIDWYWTDARKRRAAAESFVFHGPTYHGVTQADVGITHGHRLQDTASFTRTLVRRCRGLEDQPFSLAIAGYGTGKSHLALALASLLSDPTSPEAEGTLQSLESADEAIGNEVRALLLEDSRPFLVVALNGMQNFDLTAEVTRQVLFQVRARDLDTRRLDELRPRFGQAASLIQMSSDSVVEELLSVCEVEDSRNLLDALEKQDERTYIQVHDFFASKGMPIRALGGESTRDVLDAASREYCGDGRPFARLVILFDEFGRYTEFATVRSQIAGSGALQDMFEGVQANGDAVTFVGFIQFELNAYVQRVAAEFKNDILRYVTRYQSADKAYLSINLETLIAHLIEKEDQVQIGAWFAEESARDESNEIMENLHAWFPQSQNHRLWTDPEQFHTVIREGCWPLSPCSLWFLFYLTTAGKHLQERSALSLLGEVFDRFGQTEVPEGGGWSIAPADLWSDALQEELLASEESGQQGSITHAYSSVIARHGEQLGDDPIRLLRAIVLSSKLGLQVQTKEQAVLAMSELAGVSVHAARDGVEQLQAEYNVIEWDQSFRQFDILGDAVPRTQFLSFIRQRVASGYDEEGKASLFASRAQSWCDLLGDQECDFAEENSITTREWRYEAVTSTMRLLETHAKFAASRWGTAVAVDEARGTVIYCYVEQSCDPQAAEAETRKLLRSTARELGIPALPIFVVLLCDEEGVLGQTLAELAVLEDSLTEEDKARFGNLVGAHVEKARKTIRTHIDEMIRRRGYVTALAEEPASRRLARFGTELFAQIYKKPLPFPFDGFSTARGNAADSCQQLITELLQGSLDYDSAIAKPAKVKNRAIAVLQRSWGVFTKTGTISMRPSHPSIRSITERWDKALQAGERRLAIAHALRQVCFPPNGANIASAGLLLGVYVAARIEKLTVVRDGQQVAISQWLQVGVFRGKFLDLTTLGGDELVLVGEESSEWEALLDEWDQVESYYERSKYLERAVELKDRVPVPPSLGYRLVHLEGQAGDAVKAIRVNDEHQSDALMKLKEGDERGDVGRLSWGAASLMGIRDTMLSEAPLWTEHQIGELEPHIEMGRQRTILVFSDWLSKQAPRGDSPDTVGDFKHHMLRRIGGNLKKLGLEAQYRELEERVAFLVRNAETVAEARQLLRDIASWLDQHGDVCRIARVAEIRGFLGVAKEFASKLQGIARRVDLSELSAARQRLSEFANQLKDTEARIMKRAEALWRSTLQSTDDMDSVNDEVEALMRAFEGCDTDLEDLRLMRRVLSWYRHGYLQLQDERLAWDRFDSLAKELTKEAASSFGEDELPWPPDTTLKGFIEEISKNRRQRSLKWIQEMESDTRDVGGMEVEDANRLHDRSVNPPPWLTDQHSERLRKLTAKITARLDALALEWLVERFRLLPPTAKRTFLQLAAKILEES